MPGGEHRRGGLTDIDVGKTWRFWVSALFGVLVGVPLALLCLPPQLPGVLYLGAFAGMFPGALIGAWWHYASPERRRELPYVKALLPLCVWAIMFTLAFVWLLPRVRAAQRLARTLVSIGQGGLTRVIVIRQESPRVRRRDYIESRAALDRVSQALLKAEPYSVDHQFPIDEFAMTLIGDETLILADCDVLNDMPRDVIVALPAGALGVVYVRVPGLADHVRFK